VRRVKMNEVLKQPKPEGTPAPVTPAQGGATTDAAAQHVVASLGPGAVSHAKRKRHAQSPKRRGRLNPEVLAKIGRGLRECFPDTGQEVPERFKRILQQL